MKFGTPLRRHHKAGGHRGLYAIVVCEHTGPTFIYEPIWVMFLTGPRAGQMFESSLRYWVPA